MKTVIEPSGATAPAALLAGRVDAVPRRAGVTLPACDLDAQRFAQLIGWRPARDRLATAAQLGLTPAS